MTSLSVVSLNVRGMRNDKRYNIFNWLRTKKFDVCLLQETFCDSKLSKKFNKGWAGQVLHSYSKSIHSRGVCIVLGKQLNCRVIDTITDNDGRFILSNNNVAYSMCDIYAPTDFCVFVVVFPV